VTPQHGRHYSLEQANAALPRVAELLQTLRSASERLGDREAREALGEAAPGNGGGAPGRTVSEGFLALRDAMYELREREIVLRDLARGLIDFPAMRDGREIYLCWEEGEQEIAFWHEPDAGFAGRRPLESG
jgi:hypothetical protein